MPAPTTTCAECRGVFAFTPQAQNHCPNCVKLAGQTRPDFSYLRGLDDESTDALSSSNADGECAMSTSTTRNLVQPMRAEVPIVSHDTPAPGASLTLGLPFLVGYNPDVTVGKRWKDWLIIGLTVYSCAATVLGAWGLLHSSATPAQPALVKQKSQP